MAPKHLRGKEKKGKGTKERPKSDIYVFCEGKTEEIYLKHFSNRTYNVSVIPVDIEHTDAVGIVRYAKEYIEKNPLNLELGDRGYCVFDSDPKSNPNISEAFDLIKGARHKGLECIFSNPCFEVWFVLHYTNAPVGKNAQQMKSCVKKLVKNEYSEYCETTDIFELLLPKQQGALKRAKLLATGQAKVYKDVHSHECNPYTDMYSFLAYMDTIKEKRQR